MKNKNLSFDYLVNADFSHKFLQGANFEGSCLKGANFSYSDLSYCNLRNANLEGANLTSCNLYEANLEGANLKDANFSFCVGNAREIFSMQLDVYPFVWNRKEIFIGCFKTQIQKLLKSEALCKLYKNETKEFYKYERLIREAISLTIGVE
ncbi:hypothetical protein B6S12_07570 [Helicobacter valdiviensis]|uniref:Low-complexity protein n=1 Tax=Helicobacter valdiviensis TaxID=1458358 RepID=A0A2W6MUT0_9HELI|nr:pentapeptide repeat-containing protein [Helicobacter valdiviensis]PZT47711.1 hypothetical protein B6S12_07570 [Helicobacter valdiviensis]